MSVRALSFRRSTASLLVVAAASLGTLASSTLTPSIAHAEGAETPISEEAKARFAVGVGIDSDGFDARTLRELRDVVAANKELIERAWNDYFA